MYSLDRHVVKTYELLLWKYDRITSWFHVVLLTECVVYESLACCIWRLDASCWRWWLAMSTLVRELNTTSLQLTNHATNSSLHWWYIFIARCTIVQRAVLRLHVICPSVRLSVTSMDQDHIGSKSWKLSAWTISPTSLLFVAQRPSTYSQGNVGEILGRP